jgi:hypothetical protein
MTDIQSQIDAVSSKQKGNEFSSDRYAYFFKPGQYNLDVRVDFYMQVLGLGHSPDDVTITGAVRGTADWFGGNATLNFWRGAENFAVVPTQDSNTAVWAVSQGTWIRRAHIKGPMNLWDGCDTCWASGGFIADSKIDMGANSGTQQQFMTRNTDLGSWQSGSYNMVFIGDGQPPASMWPSNSYSVIDTTPSVREKPFLFVDDGGNYYVMVPGLKAKSQGSSWGSGAAPGSYVPIDQFYIAHPDTDTASSMNAALAQGKHLLLTPGIYHLDASLQVSQPGAIVFGLGLATLINDTAAPVITISDVDGVTVAGFILEAGGANAPTILQVGEPGSAKDHTANPTALFDVLCRIGGANPGTAASCFTINSNDVLVDETWLWRADHGAGADWNGNKADNGLIVNGNRVTIYGLFVEHFQQFQTLWNGNDGTMYFYQSEMPYDAPSQADWQHGGVNGYASYKVADTVTSHDAEGLGVYCVFSNNVVADDAIEAPTAAGVSMHHMALARFGGSGGITHIFNGTGAGVDSNTQNTKSAD